MNFTALLQWAPIVLSTAVSLWLAKWAHASTRERDESQTRLGHLRWKIEQGADHLAKAQKLAQTASCVGEATNVEAAHNDVRERAYELLPKLRLVFGEKDAGPLVLALADSARLHGAGEKLLGPDVLLPLISGFANMNRALEKMQADLERADSSEERERQASGLIFGRLLRALKARF